MAFISCFALILCLTTSGWAQIDKPSHYPVILVPGLHSSQIYAKLESPSTSTQCQQLRTNNYVSLWINPSLPLECVTDNMRVDYNRETHRIQNKPGVQTQVPGFGSTLYLANLGSPGSGGDYFANLIKELTNLGYVDKITLRGAPYDFRKGLNEFDDYYVNLKELVEDTYKKSGNAKVVFVAHDFGSVISTIFLSQQSQQWKDTYVKSLISLSGPFGGYITPVLAYLQTFQGNAVSFIRNYSAPFAQFPTSAAFSENYVIVQTRSKNYTLGNIKELFLDINQPDSWSQYQDNYPFVSNLNAPGVELHCLYGNATTTLTRIRYPNNDFPYGETSAENDLGDGRVPNSSLKVCASFATKQTQPVHDVPLRAYSHLDLIKFGQPIEYIKKVITTN